MHIVGTFLHTCYFTLFLSTLRQAKLGIKHSFATAHSRYNFPTHLLFYLIFIYVKTGQVRNKTQLCNCT